jgi:uncharacterized protein YjdB
MRLDCAIAFYATVGVAGLAGCSASAGTNEPYTVVPESVATRLRILPSDPVVAIGASMQLRVTVERSGAEVALPYTWRSSDIHVATVNAQGLVRGVEQGRAVITVRSYNGLEGSAEIEVR